VALHGHTRAGQRRFDLRRIAADQRHGTGMPGDAVGQRRKVLTLAVAAKDEHQLGRCAVGTQAEDGGHRGANIRALGIVKELDAVDAAHGLDAMRFAAIFAQAVQHGRQLAAGCRRQRQGSQRVGGVVAAAHAQRVGRHQALDDEGLGLVVLLALDRRVQLQRTHQPGQTALVDKAEVACGLGRVQTEAHDMARHGAAGLAAAALDEDRRRHQAFDFGIVAVDDDDGLAAEDARLGTAVGGHVAMPVEMVLGQVQHRAGRGFEAVDAVELEAGQLQHPDLGQGLEHRAARRRRVNGQRRVLVGQNLGLFLSALFNRRVFNRLGNGLGRRFDRRRIGLLGQGLGQRVQQRRADIAGDGDAPAGALDQQAGHAGRRRLAVGAGDGEHGGRVAMLGLQCGQRIGKQVQLAPHCGAVRVDGRQACVQRRQAWALQHRVEARHHLRSQLAGDELRRLAQCCALRRLLSRVPHGHLRAEARAPTRHRQAGVTQAQHEHALISENGQIDLHQSSLAKECTAKRPRWNWLCQATRGAPLRGRRGAHRGWVISA